MNEGPVDIRDEVREQFGKNAIKYVHSESHANGADLNRIVEWLSPQHDWLCLDIATGGGHVARVLSPHVEMVVASDLTPEMLAAAKDSLAQHGLRNVSYIEADAEDLPFLDSTFDAVTCRIAPHHFSSKEQFVKEVARVLKKKGKFLLVDNIAPEDPALGHFMNRFEWMRDQSHASCGTMSEWNRMIKDSGFDILKTGTRKKVYPFGEWVKRTAETEKQVLEVEEFIKSASREAKSYFDVKVVGGKVLSLQVDEAMILAQKKRD